LTEVVEIQFWQYVKIATVNRWKRKSRANRLFLPFFFLFFSKKLPTPWSLVPSHRHWCIGCNPYNPSTIDDQKGRNKIKKGKKRQDSKFN